MVESENQNSWEWFFCQLRHAIPTISQEVCTLISDQDKGLLLAEPILGPQLMAAYCCHHLNENFIEKFGCSLAPQFWAVARAQTKAQYTVALQKLHEIKGAAATYLEQAHPEA